MQWLAKLSIKRPVFASVLMVLLVVLGIVSYGKLGLDYEARLSAAGLSRDAPGTR